MSDKRDQTRRFPAGEGDGTPSSPDDATRIVPPPVPDGDDATRIAPAPGPSDDATRIAPAAGPLDDATRIAPRSPIPPDATRVSPVSPAEDDWAPSRANPVWSGRAEVRAPQPGRTAFDTDWPTGPAVVPASRARDRWWMPIVVGIVVLIMLALLGWGIYLIVQNSDGDGTPAPGPTTAAATTTAPTTAPTTPPSSEPASSAPTTSPSTTEPTTTEVTIPALRGLALADARAALNSTGLRYYVLYRDSTEAPPDTVIDSDPAEGQEVPPDTRVTLVVAREKGASSSPSPSATPTGADDD